MKRRVALPRWVGMLRSGRPDLATETKRIVREDRALLDRLAKDDVDKDDASDGTDNDGTNDGTKQG